MTAGDIEGRITRYLKVSECWFELRGSSFRLFYFSILFRRKPWTASIASYNQMWHELSLHIKMETNIFLLRAEMKSVNIENITMVWVTACLKYWQRKLVFERGRLNLLIPKKVIRRRTSHWRQKLNIHSNYILGFFTMENFVACFLAKLFMYATQNLCS